MQAANYYQYEFEDELETCELDNEISAQDFFGRVATELAMADITDTSMEKIVFRGREWHYIGWQPDMLFEFHAVGFKPVRIWLPEWDH